MRTEEYFEVLTNLDEIRERRNILHESAKQSIDIFVGTVLLSEEQSKRVAIPLKKAFDRGVKVRLLFHLTRNNIETVLKFFSFGIEVRHSFHSGYHLRIIDNKRLMIEFLGKEGEKLRIGLINLDEIDTELFTRLFEEMWKGSISVKNRRRELIGF